MNTDFHFGANFVGFFFPCQLSIVARDRKYLKQAVEKSVAVHFFPMERIFGVSVTLCNRIFGHFIQI